jgi:hypothetical protein
MFKFLKPKQQPLSTELQNKFGNKSMNQVIEEIHDTFYTEVDRLLEEARISKSEETDKQLLIDKCNRLKSLGFKQTKEVQEAEEELSRLEVIKSENISKQNLIEAINYFSFKYPNYKFITEESVKKISAKYNLVYGSVDNYIGTVPDVNLKHMENFKISEDDECYLFVRRINGFLLGKSYLSYETYKKMEYHGQNIPSHIYEDITLKKCHLEIVAPLKDFNISGMEVKDYAISKIEIPDPIVLKPVYFNHIKYYLIVTAWGLEASDELVVNQRFN